jgi:AcrR family transcriptional regulator
MPKLSESAWESRRRHVMVSAWKCFSRQGFQATTMDQIIAETGMSSSSVYRYFASKDNLIASAAEESLTVTKGVLDELARRSPLPGPRDTLTAITKALQRQIDQPGYDLSKITVNAWAEALRQPQLHERAHHFYGETHKTLVELASLWQSEGLVASGGDPTSIADLFITLMPGMLITRHLYRPATAARLAEGILAFAAADSVNQG